MKVVTVFVYQLKLTILNKPMQNHLRKLKSRLSKLSLKRPHSLIIWLCFWGSVFMSSCATSMLATESPQITIPSMPSSELNTGYPDPGSELQATQILCVGPTEVALRENIMICVEGRVASAYTKGNDFVMEFDLDNKSVYAVSHNIFYLGIQGQCAKITGITQIDDSGRFYVRSDLPGQVMEC